MIGDIQCLVRKLLHQEDGQAIVPQRPEASKQLVDDEGRKPGRGLVEEQDLRPSGKRLGDREHLLLAAGKPSRSLALPIAEDREGLEDLPAEALALLVGSVSSRRCRA